MAALGNTQTLVLIEDVRENALVLKGGELRQVLIVGGINFSLKSEEEQNIITQAYQNFLNSLSFPLQIVVHSRKVNIDQYLKALEERRGEEPSALLQEQIAEYTEFVRGFVTENAIMAKSFLVVVPFSPVALPSKATILESLPFLRKGHEEELRKAAEATFEENLEQLRQRTTQVIEGLASIGLEAILLDNQQLVELFYNLYNPETVEREKLRLPRTER